MTLRRIITKLIIRVGSKSVRHATAKEHLSLVMYVERARRKKLNIKERARLLALMGKKAPTEGAKKDESDSDSDSDPEEQKMGDQSDESDDSSDDEEDDQDMRQGTDVLQSSQKLDIPIVRDIPILSQLAKKEKMSQIQHKKQNHDGFKDGKKAVEVMEVDELEVETHFVENPFIRTRERANRKNLDAQQMMTAEQIQEDAENQDIVMMDEKGKFLIKDLEQMEEDSKNEKIKKRKRAEITGYGKGEEIDSDIEELEMKDMQRKLKETRSKNPNAHEPSANKFKAANPTGLKKRDAKASGHIMK